MLKTLSFQSLYCVKIRRVYTVLAKSKIKEAQNFPKKQI